MNVTTEHNDTQNDRILAALRRAHGDWVPMPQLAAESGAFAVHSRISDLRKLGFAIEVKLEGQRPKRSFYRLTGTVQMPLNLGSQ